MLPLPLPLRGPLPLPARGERVGVRGIADPKGWPLTRVPATLWQYPLREDQAMPTRSFDVVILGGGNAGMGVTVATREAGLTVAMLEPDLLGGTCPNRGCMPKKVMVAAAHALDEIERATAHHIAVGKPSLAWAALMDA